MSTSLLNLPFRVCHVGPYWKLTWLHNNKKVQVLNFPGPKTLKTVQKTLMIIFVCFFFRKAHNSHLVSKHTGKTILYRPFEHDRLPSGYLRRWFESTSTFRRSSKKRWKTSEYFDRRNLPAGFFLSLYWVSLLYDIDRRWHQILNSRILIKCFKCFKNIANWNFQTIGL